MQPDNGENLQNGHGAQIVQIFVGSCIAIILGLVGYIVSTLNNNLVSAISVLQANDHHTISRLNTSEQAIVYLKTRGEINEAILTKLEARTQLQWQEINALKMKR